MKINDFVLIQRTLDGDQKAFTELVNRYQKWVHSLVWRKIGDFHTAEEITQDIFLKVYKKLSTLKPPMHFPGWLYVITSRHCIAWQRKKQQPTKSLEAMPTTELEELCYTRYEVERENILSIEHQREIVRRLLQKLPESERTVVTLHYLAEMSCEEISQFLGVSQNTVKSRLHRARKRLEKQAHLLHDASGAFQLPPTLTENIMREIGHIKPTSTTVSKPWMPWGLSFASVLLVLLMVGMGPRALSRFQKPYSLAAASEMKIELVDTPIVLELERKSNALTQIGRIDALGKNRETGSQAESLFFAAAQAEETDLPAAKPEWLQTKGPGGIGGSGAKLFLTSDQSLYAITRTALYKLTEKADMWTLVSSSAPNQIFDGVMTERDDTLYLLTSNEILASIDEGKTWDNLGRRPEGHAVALVATDTAIYLVLKTDVFRLRFEDIGHAWELIGDTLRALQDDVPEAVNPKTRPNRDAADNPNFRPGLAAWDAFALNNPVFRIWDALAIDNTLFIGTSQGLFRFTDDWEKLEVPTSHGIKSLAAAEDRLYAGTIVGPPIPMVGQGTIPIPMVGQGPMGIGTPRGGVFSSTDLGDTWTDITPKTHIHSMGTVEVVTVRDTLILFGYGLRSQDGGKTWTVPEGDLRMISMSPTIALDENNIYNISNGGIRRTIDGGVTWHPFMTGIVNSHVRNLIMNKNVLFAQTPTELLKSVDGGESWESVDLISTDEKSLPFLRKTRMKVAAANGILYASNSQPDGVTLFRISDGGDVFLSVEGVPDFAVDTLETELDKKLKIESVKAAEQFQAEWEKKREELIKNNPNVDIDKAMKQFHAEQIETRKKASGIVIQTIGNNHDLEKAMEQRFAIAAQDKIAAEQRTNGTFTVADDTVFMVFRHKLFRWRFGETAWHDTGLSLEDQDEISPIGEERFTLAASGNTVYVGKPGGELFLSEDIGDTWRDVTADLPFPGFFKEILFAGSTVYILTDIGVISSRDGETWQTWHDLTDVDGNVIFIDRIAGDGKTVYGVCDSGIYQADKQANTWKQVIPELPHRATSLAVDGNTFYIGTRQNGVYRFQRPDQ